MLRILQPETVVWGGCVAEQDLVEQANRNRGPQVGVVLSGAELTDVQLSWRFSAMNQVSRRQLLKSAAGVAGAFGIPYLISSGVLAADGKPGANDRVTVGAIGVGNRASLLLDQLPKDGQIVALSDCNLPRAEAFKAKRKGDWPVYQSALPEDPGP